MLTFGSNTFETLLRYAAVSASFHPCRTHRGTCVLLRTFVKRDRASETGVEIDAPISSTFSCDCPPDWVSVRLSSPTQRRHEAS